MAGFDVASHPLLEAGRIAALVVHLAWVGLVAGTATVAVAVDALGGPGRRGLARAIVGQTGSLLIALAWLEVTATLTLVGVRVAHPVFVQTGGFWAGTLLTLAAGLTLVGLFASLVESARWASLRPAVGLAGIGLLLASAYLLCAGSGVLLQPEAWPTAEPFFRFLPTWSGTGRFAEFTCLSLAATGVVISTLGAPRFAVDDARFARRFGGWMALVSLLAWPVAALFTLLNLPAIALSSAVWGVTGAGFALAGATTAPDFLARLDRMLAEEPALNAWRI